MEEKKFVFMDVEFTTGRKETYKLANDEKIKFINTLLQAHREEGGLARIYPLLICMINSDREYTVYINLTHVLTFR